MNKISNIKISVIVPTFNREKKIRKCLDTIVSQTLKTLVEIIIIDDGDDRTATVVDDFILANSHIKFTYYKPDLKLGLSKARNYALDRAQGDIVIFLDSDNELSRGAFKTITDVFKKNQAIDLAFFRSTTKSKKRFNNPKLNHDGLVDYSMFLRSLPFQEYLPVVSHKAVKNGYRFVESIWGFEGYLWLKMIKERSVFFVCNVEVLIYDDSGADRLSAISTKQAQNRVHGILIYLEEFGLDLMLYNFRYYRRLVYNLVGYYLVSDQHSSYIRVRVLSQVVKSKLIGARLALYLPKKTLKFLFPMMVWYRKIL